MGNMLESDSSSQSEDNLDKEVRTEGDGMECIAEDTAVPVREISAIKTIQIHDISGGAPVEVLPSFPAVKSSAQLKDHVEKTSPRQLPPKERLITIKPLKMLERQTTDPNMATAKQKQPKFVPYEPYKGATRSMLVDKPTPSHARKDSTSTTSSINSGKNSSAEIVHPGLNSGIGASSSTLEPKQLPVLSSVFAEKDQCSILLLKERLRISEKDVNELQKENRRLKKMLVDSMSGGAPISNSEAITSRNGSLNGSESVDNLVDEIEVWRSKFLSSCVLVEQLSKQNQDWKDKVASAANLFRETKRNSEVVLTPHLFHKMNAWLHQDNIPTFHSACQEDQDEFSSGGTEEHQSLVRT